MSIHVDRWYEELHNKINELDIKRDDLREITSQLYLGMHPVELKHRVVRDVPYGPHERNLLDVHFPNEPSNLKLPILCFVHGGGFVNGDKSRPGQPYYDNICRWGVDNGFTVFNMSYRLAPEFMYPSGSQDVAAALRWIQEHANEYGGDQDTLVVMGHSAGAAHVADFVADPSLRAQLKVPLAAAILSSGIYDPSMAPNLGVKYYGNDQELNRSHSSIEGLCTCEIPILISIAQLDPPHLQRQMLQLVDTYFGLNGVLPQVVQSASHNHFSVMFQIGTAETWLSDRLKSFIQTVASRHIGSNQ